MANSLLHFLILALLVSNSFNLNSLRRSKEAIRKDVSDTRTVELVTPSAGFNLTEARQKQATVPRLSCNLIPAEIRIGVITSKRTKDRILLGSPFLTMQNVFLLSDSEILPTSVKGVSTVWFPGDRGKVVYRTLLGIKHMFEAPGPEVAKWFFVGDDDTTLFTENLLCTLSNLDYNRHIYIGDTTESKIQARRFGTDMAYGGGGIVLSRAWAAVVASFADECIAKVDSSYGGDKFLLKCLRYASGKDQAVPKPFLTNHVGFHQLDLLQDISGLIEGYFSRTATITIHHLAMVEFTEYRESAPVVSALYRNVPHHLLFQRFVVKDPDLGVAWVVCFGYSVLAVPLTIFNQDFLDKVERTWHGMNSFKRWDEEYFPNPSVKLRPAITDPRQQLRYQPELTTPAFHLYRLATTLIPVLDVVVEKNTKKSLRLPPFVAFTPHWTDCPAKGQGRGISSVRVTTDLIVMSFQYLLDC